MVRVLYKRVGFRSRFQSCLLWAKIFSQVIVFVFGLFLGVLFSLTLFPMAKQSHVTQGPRFYRIAERGQRGHLNSEVKMLESYHSMNETFHNGEDIVAEEMKSKVRVLCLVLTTKETFENSGESIKQTWGRRCNTLLFVSDFEDSALPVVRLHAGSGQLEKWALIKSSMKHLFVHFLSTHDWVLRVDDHTFVVMENLRYLLSKYKPSDPLYLGFRLKKFVEQGFMVQDAGYVLSRDAVWRLVTEGISKNVCYVGDQGAEDVELGKCLEALNVTLVDTRDSLGRGRFFPFGLYEHLIPGILPPDSWFWDRSYYPVSAGFNCCSDTAISFHGQDHEAMRVLDYLIYHLRPYGINSWRPMKTDNHTDTKYKRR